MEWNQMLPEFDVFNLEESLYFYTDLVGFKIGIFVNSWSEVLEKVLHFNIFLTFGFFIKNPEK